jgi:hypothetical protein
MLNVIEFHVKALINKDYQTFIQELITKEQFTNLFHQIEAVLTKIETSDLEESTLQLNKLINNCQKYNSLSPSAHLQNNSNEMNTDKLSFDDGLLIFTIDSISNLQQITAFAKILEIISNDLFICQIKTQAQPSPQSFTSLGTWVS